MGITGLLPFLKAIQRDVHLSSFKGKKVAVDSYCWLHKGSYSCAMQLVMGTDKLESLPFIKYCMRKVNLLRQYDITPVMVFDGGYLPTKAHTEQERRQRRREYKEKGKQLLKEGRKSDAVDCFQKCVDVSPAMALVLIKECRKLGIECVVAPYEADAQLTYLQKKGLVDFVITEDSDLLVFGCERVLFKLDESGRGKLIELQELGKANKGLVGFTQESFRQMCIFSGCDYLPSVPGIGLGKALKLMRRCNQNPIQVIKTLQFETGKVPPDYEKDFQRAEHTFLYQLVFDPRTQSQVRLHPLPEDLNSQDIEFAGVENSPVKAVSMARGNIDPISLQVLDSYSPSKAPLPKATSWDSSVLGTIAKYPVAIQARLPLSASQRTKQPFKAPKRKLDVLEDEECAEEALCSLYTTKQYQNCTSEVQESGRSEGSSEMDGSNQPVTSKFFPSEATPSDTCTSELPVRQALSDKQLSQQTVRKQLFTTEEPRESVKRMRSLFQFSSVKRRRTESEESKHPFQLLEQSSLPSTQPSVHTSETVITCNPFSVSKSSPKKTPSFTTTSLDPSLSPLEPPKALTSASFIDPHPSLKTQGWLSKSRTAGKRTTRVGLSKSTTGSNFKAPRLSEQTTLSMFGYTRRPQLKY